eukprot:2419298-Rhodomonas_salina.3
MKVLHAARTGVVGRRYQEMIQATAVVRVASAGSDGSAGSAGSAGSRAPGFPSPELLWEWGFATPPRGW